MSMSKKDFIALGAAIREHNQAEYNLRANQGGGACDNFSPVQLEVLADFCHSTNPRFNRERWLGYIRGECGPSGGAVKKS
jgi:hypothetical protein